MSYSLENKVLFNKFLCNTFLGNFRKKGNRNENLDSIELIVSPVCNLACKYCYLTRYSKKLYKEDIRNKETILNNMFMVIDWLIENSYTPELEYFSGEALVQEVGLEGLDLLYEKYSKVSSENRIKLISLPTNYTFLLDDELTDRVVGYINKFTELNIGFWLSASVDGKYCESNRPILHKKIGKLSDGYIIKPEVDLRDDAYYDKMFEFNKKYYMGFHPMVYSRKIESWIDNFLWFQENFKKYDIPPHSLYLLEVRNVEWNDWQTKKFSEFIEFIIKWTYNNIALGDRHNFKDFIFNKKGFNILSSPFNTIGRGLGCSLQSVLYVRMGDLAIVPCHRTMYDTFKYGQFIVEGNKITGIEGVNPELAVAVLSGDFKTSPWCESCLIKYNCSLGCLGSQFESNGDFFTPTPSVCKLEHAKVYTIAKTLKDMGILNFMLDGVNSKNAYGLRKILELI